jgi:hypothetical protein
VKKRREGRERGEREREEGKERGLHVHLQFHPPPPKCIAGREEWSDLNLLFVGFGQTICAPIKPKCDECLNKEICLESPHNKLGTRITVGKLGKRSPNKGNSSKGKKIKVEKL